MQMFRFEPSDAALAQMPRKPVRLDGIATYHKLVEAVDAIYGADTKTTLSLKAVADMTGVPVASVYHFFPSPDAALAALTEKYIERGAIEVLSHHVCERGQNWQGVVRSIFERGRTFYEKYPAAGKLRLGPGQCASVRHLIVESNWALAETIRSELARLFKLPNAPSLVDDIAYAIVMSDALWSLSYALHNEVTRHFAEEAERAVVGSLHSVLGRRMQVRSEEPVLN